MKYNENIIRGDICTSYYRPYTLLYVNNYEENQDNVGGYNVFRQFDN